MDKFVVKRSQSDADASNASSENKKAKASSNSATGYTASLKTAEKWMKELNIDLAYECEGDSVHKIVCTTCKLYAPANMASNFTTGNSTVKSESVKFHVTSTMHERAVQTKAAQEKRARNEQTDLEKGFQKMDMATSDKMTKLFKTAYYVAIFERPFTDFPSLIDLQHCNGLSLGDTYHTHKAATDLIEHIGGVYFDETKRLLHDADYFSIFCDGSTDRSETEKEVILIKCLEDCYPKMKYLKLVEPDNTKSEGILAAIDRAFLAYDLNNYKQKTVGFCSDGTFVMMGSKRGVIQLMKIQGNANWIKAVWCLVHRLELAVKDAFIDTYMDNVIEMLVSIYYFL